MRKSSRAIVSKSSSTDPNIPAAMKNIIDGATNCTFSLFQATDEEFELLFPEPRQDIQYAEDLAGLPRQDEIAAAYREKREDAVDRSAINAAQRRLFGIP
jgi:hypothetical protein